MAGQFGQWTPIGAEQTASGYEVAWKVTGADQYAVWDTDSNGNYTSNILDTVSGTDPTLQSIETSFQQDLNGDGYIGLVGVSRASRKLRRSDAYGKWTVTTLDRRTRTISSMVVAGADTFVFPPNFGANMVNNFNPGTDQLEFSQSMFANVAEVLSDAQQVGSDVVIAHDPQDVVTLHNVLLSNLHASDFHLV